MKRKRAHSTGRDSEDETSPQLPRKRRAGLRDASQRGRADDGQFVTYQYGNEWVNE